MMMALGCLLLRVGRVFGDHEVIAGGNDSCGREVVSDSSLKFPACEVNGAVRAIVEFEPFFRALLIGNEVRQSFRFESDAGTEDDVTTRRIDLVHFDRKPIAALLNVRGGKDEALQTGVADSR